MSGKFFLGKAETTGWERGVGGKGVGCSSKVTACSIPIYNT